MARYQLAEGLNGHEHVVVVPDARETFKTRIYAASPEGEPAILAGNDGQPVKLEEFFGVLTGAEALGRLGYQVTARRTKNQA